MSELEATGGEVQYNSEVERELANMVRDHRRELELAEKQIGTYANLLLGKDTQIGQLKALITELCDALEEEYGSVRGDGHMSNLLIRARDAANG